MAYTTNGVPYVQPTDAVSDYPNTSLELANYVQTLQQELDVVESYPRFTGGFTSSNSTGDGDTWSFPQYGCPAEVDDIIAATVAWYHSPSTNILAARLFLTSGRPLAHTGGYTWYYDGQSHGVYGAVTAFFKVVAGDLSGGQVALQVNMNNGGVPTYDTFTCHGWINYGKHDVTSYGVPLPEVDAVITQEAPDA